MPVGLPLKTTYANGDVFSASDINDTNGTVNLLNPTAKGGIVSASAANTPSVLAVGSNFAFLQADSSTATGLLWDNATWTSYTPTITSGTGSFTSVNGSGSYKRIGKVCALRIQVNIVTNGTAGGVVFATLPFSAVSASQGVFREGAVTGNCGIWEPAGATSFWRTFTNGYPGGTGYSLNGTIVYEVA